MYTFDPRTQINPFQTTTQTPIAQNPWGVYGTDYTQLLSGIQSQLNLITEYIRADLNRRSEMTAPVQSPVRLRESDSHIYCELFLAQLTVGDVEVEVAGNRIICRTRIPFFAGKTWFTTATVPRGFEVFELPDGRIELSWVCPVAFQAKEIEASFREGALCISIPKSEAVVTRQTVKVAKEQIARVQ
jgi:HSP20 family molecular chaperone IbpA